MNFLSSSSLISIFTFLSFVRFAVGGPSDSDTSALSSPALLSALNIISHLVTPTNVSTISTKQGTLSNSTQGGVTWQGCFPSVGFQMPNGVPSSMNGWWCSSDKEYGFVGFGYDVTSCQAPTQLTQDFKNIQRTFGGRYVRLYGACDRPGFYNDIVEAAWDSGIGVFALIWFGFDGSNQWMTRRDSLFNILHTNPKAKFVTRALQFGSEPLFDGVLPPYQLTSEVEAAKKNLSSLQIPVTASDMAYSFNQLHANDGGPGVLECLDVIAAHILPFFTQGASTASNAWPFVLNDMNYFIQNANNRKIYFVENGWPSAIGGSVGDSSGAIADVQNEADYYVMLDSHCPDFKAAPGGGIAWFAHLYIDGQYGIYDLGGNLKFNFAPRSSC